MITNYNTFITENNNIAQEDLYDWADNYLNGDIPQSDRNWKDYMYIDVTGRLSIYFTLWKVKNGNGRFFTKYVKNISNDFKNAILKLKKEYPYAHIEIFSDSNRDFFIRDKFSFPFGKYINQNIYDVAKTPDGKKYILWAVGHSKDIKDAINFEVKSMYNGNVGLRKLNEKEKHFIEILKEIGHVIDLERYGVTQDNKEDLSNKNNTKYEELLNVLKNANNTPFIADMIKRIENGADTTKFSDKQNEILAKVYSKSLKNVKNTSELYEYMLNLLKGNEIKKPEIVNKKNIEKNIEIFYNTVFDTEISKHSLVRNGKYLFNETYKVKGYKYEFKDVDGNFYWYTTEKEYPFKVGEQLSVSFFIKKVTKRKIDKGDVVYYYIIDLDGNFKHE